MKKPEAKFTIRVSNLLPFCRKVQVELQKVSDLSFTAKGEYASKIIDQYSITQIFLLINRRLNRLRNSFKKKSLSPSHLPLPSYRAFIWLSFLENEERIQEHILSLQEFEQLANELIHSGASIERLLNPRLVINIFYLPYIFQTKKQRHQVNLSIHEAMITAPREIKKDLILAALKGNKNSLRNLRKYCSSHAYYRMENLIRNGQKAQGSSPHGMQVDLIQVFEKVNHEYFNSKLERPQLSWSSKKSYRRLGTYSAQLDQVTISRALDRSDYPSYLIEFIMYHELLHKKVGVQQANSGKHNHTKAFKELEQHFKFYDEANHFMKTLAPKNRGGAFRSILGR